MYIKPITYLHFSNNTFRVCPSRKHMKSILAFFILCSVKLFAQERPLFTDDSQIVKCHVKSRIKHYTPNAITSYSVDYFNEKGFMYRSEVLNPYFDIPVITTEHYQDSLGRKYTSTTVINTDTLPWIGYFEFYEGNAKSVTVYYQYNENNKLHRSYSFDTISRNLLFETFYTYNPKMVIKKWYDKSGLIIKEKLDSLEINNFIVKSEYKTYDSIGNILSHHYENYANKYNSDGQLIESFYESHKCPRTLVKYKYYKNGLIKLKKGDKCLLDWNFEYEYYK